MTKIAGTGDEAMNGVSRKVVYLTNACGEDTGYGTVTEADCSKVPFERGPGFVLPYLTRIDAAVHLQGNLEVCFKDAFWHGDDDEMPTIAEAALWNVAARDFIQRRLGFGGFGTRLLPRTDDMPGRFVIEIAIPIKNVRDRTDGFRKLAAVFGNTATLEPRDTFGDYVEQAQMKWFVVGGRVCGDDESTTHIFQADDREHAIEQYVNAMTSGLTKESIEALARESGTDSGVFVDCVLESDTQIREAEVSVPTKGMRP